MTPTSVTLGKSSPLAIICVPSRSFHLAGAKRGERPLVAAAALHGVGVHAQARHIGEAGANFRFQALRAQARIADAHEAAAEARRWCRHLVIAEMTQGNLLRAMVRERDVAMRAREHVAARRALDMRGKPAPVQEQDHLAPALQRLCDGRVQLPADRAVGERAAVLVDPQVDRADQRQRAIQHAARHIDQQIRAALGLVPAFQRRRGGA